MTIEEFRAKYKGKATERYNKCIRAEFDGGNELLELRRYVSYLRNVKPMWDLDIEDTRALLNSIKRQTPQTGHLEPVLNYINQCLDSKPMAGGMDEARSILGRIETILTTIRDSIIAEIKQKYGFGDK